MIKIKKDIFKNLAIEYLYLVFLKIFILKFDSVDIIEQFYYDYKNLKKLKLN